MQLPDGTTLMHAGKPYDPVQAHRYYEEHKHLKGRKKGAAPKPPAKKTAPKRSAKQAAAWKKFLGNLPMAQEGASLADTEKFVNSLRGKSDADLKKLAADITAKYGKKDGARVATIQKLLTNRERIRKADPKTLNAAERAPQRKAAADQVTSARKKLSGLNDQIKKDPSKKEHLSAQVEAAKKTLSDAIKRQRALTPATKK